MTHTTPENRHQQIAAMLRDGATYLEIASELHVGASTIRHVRVTLNIPVPQGRPGARPLTEEERRAAAEQRYPEAAAMLRAGSSHRQIAAACGIGIGTVSEIRTALNIPSRRGSLAGQRHALDDQIAALLTAGRTNTQIRAQLKVGPTRVSRVLRERGITLPPARARRTRAELAAAEQKALAMLRAGATYNSIRAATRVSTNTLSKLRKQHNIPLPARTPAPQARKPARPMAEALALHTQPYGNGHARWTGPHNGHQGLVWAEGRRSAVPREAFTAHHQRKPVGYVKTNCDELACIAGPHLTDQLIRAAHTRADQAFEQIFGDRP